MFWKKRNRKRNDVANTTINWIIIGVVLAAIFQNQRGRITETEDLPEAASQIAGKTIVDLKHYKNKILPPQPKTITLQDVEMGSGAPALCGQTVTLAYQAYDTEGKTLPDSATAEKPLAFTLGQNKAMPAFEEGVAGMKKGGIRKIFAPATDAYGAEGFAREGLPTTQDIRFDAELLNITPPLPDPEATSYRFLDVRKGLGKTLNCGGSAPFHVTVWNTDGGKIYSSRSGGKEPITISPGSAKHFMGLEFSVLGMKTGGMRTAIVPPAFQQPLKGTEKTLDIPFPKNQTVLVDIEWVE
ncbi:MAG: FKBP-type peptidyl-prolyl cis-trans isomerase [Rickettsiales bacterium]|nr:FKBP-type peptidyl-prolyl cis-trans isomerase [Rickettsiales bacterium]